MLDSNKSRARAYKEQKFRLRHSMASRGTSLGGDVHVGPISGRPAGVCGRLEALLAQAQLERKDFDREQLARRMGIVAAAGVTDPEEFKRCVLSEDGA